MRITLIVSIILATISPANGQEATSAAGATTDGVCEYISAIPKNLIRDYLLGGGYADFNNDGKFEYLRQGLTGTMGGDAPCLSENNNSQDHTNCKSLRYDDGSEQNEKILWAHGSSVFPYKNRYYVLYSSEEDHKFPVGVGLIDGDSVQIACHLENEVRELTTSHKDGLCLPVNSTNEPAISFNLPTLMDDNTLTNKFEQSLSQGVALIDFDNDGVKEPLMKIKLSYGGGRGCDHTYFRLLTDDMKDFSSDKKAELLDAMQVEACRPNAPIWFEKNGITYLEDKPEMRVITDDEERMDIQRTSDAYHTLKYAQNGQITEVCNSTFINKTHVVK